MSKNDQQIGLKKVRKQGNPVDHYEKIDKSRIDPFFSKDNLHRVRLSLPFIGREDGKTLCIIGQNPSYAGATYADKTIAYLEQYVYKHRRDVGTILMLNLFSLIDTTKSQSSAPNTEESDEMLRESIRAHDEFLIVFGKFKKQGIFDFRKRAREIMPLFAGKTVHKIDIETPYAPHPGNRKIFYRHFQYKLCPYDFSDISF